MESKNQKGLEEAKAYFYSWKLPEAYALFRRYFDRLPFKPEAAHAENIGLFARVLLELGKENELKFYMGELERIYSRSKSPAIAYTLGVVYTFLSEPKMELARSLFEEIMRNPEAKEYQTKAKIMLANYYDRVKDDLTSCRLIIDSISTPADATLKTYVDIWKAKLLREEGKLDASEDKYRQILKSISPESDWYGYFSAMVGLAFLYLAKKSPEKAESVVAEIKLLFEGKNFKSVQIQLDKLDKLLEEQSPLGILHYELGKQVNRVRYEDKSLQFGVDLPADRLLAQFLKKRFLNKSCIIKNLLERDYDSKRDDKIIYYHIHAIRKKLQRLGLPAEAIAHERTGYRLTPQVELMGPE